MQHTCLSCFEFISLSFSSAAASIAANLLLLSVTEEAFDEIELLMLLLRSSSFSCSSDWTEVRSGPEVEVLRRSSRRLAWNQRGKC